eukprot:9339871-Alexandrium_andersonii.AAC.1
MWGKALGFLRARRLRGDCATLDSSRVREPARTAGKRRRPACAHTRSAVVTSVRQRADVQRTRKGFAEET